MFYYYCLFGGYGLVLVGWLVFVIICDVGKVRMGIDIVLWVFEWMSVDIVCGLICGKFRFIV